MKMKNPIKLFAWLFTVALLLTPCLLFGQVPGDTNVVVVAPTVPDVTAAPLPISTADYWTYAIAIVVPLLVGLIKKLKPSIPTWVLPVSTPIVGLAIGGLLQWAGAQGFAWWHGGLAGAAGVMVREAFNKIITTPLKGVAAAKTKGPVIALLLCGLMAGAGCATLFDVAKIESRAKGITFAIAASVLRNNPSTRDEFILASSDLKFVAAQDVIDVTTVMAIISQLPPLQDGNLAIFIQAGVIIFAGELDSLAVKNPVQVKLAAAGFYKGIDLALGFVPPQSLRAPSRTLKASSPNVRE